MEQLDTTIINQNKPKRSEFFTVLCILSFVMCFISLLSGIWGIYQSSPDVMQSSIEKVRAIDPLMADQMETQFINMQSDAFTKITPYLGLVYTLLSFLGVLLMWNFKRVGFYLYSIAEILPYTSIVFASSSSMMIPGVPKEAMMVAMALMIVIDVVFVYLYSRNIKDME